MGGGWKTGRWPVMLVAVVSPLTGQETNEHRPVLSPDGTRVVFMRQSPETGGDWELYLTDLAGTATERLTRSEGWDGYAVFAPDGRTLVFDRATAASGDAKHPHLLDLESGRVHPLGSFEGWLSVSDWSAEHGLLAFWERDGQRDLVLLDTEGTVVRRLTETPGISEHDAHFSPDGRSIVFASGPAHEDGPTRLEMIRATGGDRHTLVESPGRLYGAAWSPSGKRVAFTDAPDGENGDLFVLEVGSGTVERLTSDPAWDHMPVWGPEGDRILFTSYRSGPERMYWLDPASGAVTPWEVR